MQRSVTTTTTSTRSVMPPGTPTPRAHVRTAPGRISRPSTAPTPTTDGAPQLLPATSPIPSRQASPVPSPVVPPLPPAVPPATPSGSGSAPATAGVQRFASSNGILDWPGFLAAYANGEWDPNRIPDPPMLLAPAVSRSQRSPSPLVPTSALSSSSTVATYSPDSATADNTLSPPSLGGLAGPDRPRITPESRVTSIASRRGTATPGSTPFKINLGPYVHAPRKVQRSQSDVEVRSPGGVTASATPAIPSPSIDRAATAATIRWAGSGVDVAPYALPSPESAELLDPMRHAHPVLNITNPSTKSRLSTFWQGSPQDTSPAPAANNSTAPPVSPQLATKSPLSPQRPKRAATAASSSHSSTLHADYFGSARSPSSRLPRSPSSP
ncbi:hypothetical protein FRC07_011313, partial [Ceratobasidium sp. 392]